jgi:hypothetical protein
MIHVIVPTCDKYAPIIPRWLVFFYRAWTLPHRVTILGVSRDSLRIPVELRWNPVTCVYVETDAGWTTNLLRYLATLGDEPFMMMMDDHIMFEANADLLRLASEIITRPDVGCVRLVPWPGPTLDFDAEGFGEIDKRLEYAVSLQASFWKPQTLRDLLEPGWSPWQVEVEGSKRAVKHPMRFIGCKSCAVNYKDYYMRGKPRENHAAWVDEHL